MDIHDVSDVNKPDIDLSLIPGPAHADDFKHPNTAPLHKEINLEESGEGDNL
jgi:hypothetical protein